MVYTEGSDFWVVADKKVSSWTLKLDWYVNFLMAKTDKVERHELSSNLKKILEEEELEFPKIAISKNPNLYIATKNLLPCLGLLVIPNSSLETKNWLEEIKRKWENLNKPSLRVFLPKGFDAKEFETFCKENIPTEVTYVTDETFYN